nr:ribonuclease H [Tanacetum cinerariifolium]
MESLNSNSQERERDRERVASVATHARQCKGKLHDIFSATSFISTDQLQNQLDKDEFQEEKSMAAFWVLNNQFQNGTKSDEHITSSSSGTYITHVVDADIRAVNDQEPSAEVNSRDQVQSPNSRNNIKPAKRAPNVNKADIQEPVVSTSTPSSTRIDQDTSSTSTSQTIKEAQSHVIPTSVEEDDHGIKVAHMDNDLQIKEQKENGVVELYFVGTEYQLPDIFSKPLGREKLEFLMKKVGMQSMSLETLKKLADKTEELWWVIMSWIYKRSKRTHLQISVDTLHNTNFFRALTALADVPSSFTRTTKTTSTLPPPPPPLQQSTVYRDIW